MIPSKYDIKPFYLWSMFIDHIEMNMTCTIILLNHLKVIMAYKTSASDAAVGSKSCRY